MSRSDIFLAIHGMKRSSSRNGMACTSFQTIRRCSTGHRIFINIGNASLSSSAICSFMLLDSFSAVTANSPISFDSSFAPRRAHDRTSPRRRPSASNRAVSAA